MHRCDIAKGPRKKRVPSGNIRRVKPPVKFGESGSVCCGSQLVQWRLPSLRCMGSEQLSLFACRNAFNSVTISMRLLRQRKDVGSLLLLYRHCSRALAQIIIKKVRRPKEACLSTCPPSENRRQKQKAWAEAFASGLITLDPQQQKLQHELVRNHSICLLGTGAACIMDLRKACIDGLTDTSTKTF